MACMVILIRDYCYFQNFHANSCTHLLNLQAVMPAFGWRWLLALSSLPSFALLLFYPVTLESPRYLCMKGRIAEAVHVLETMSRVNCVSLPSGRLVSGHRVELHDIGDSSETAQLVTSNKNNTADRGSKSEIGGLSAILKLLSPNLIRSTLLLWTVFLGHAFLYYGLVLLTSELNHGNRICGSEEGAEVTTTAHIHDENLYRNVFITSFGGMCVSAIWSTSHFSETVSWEFLIFRATMMQRSLVFSCRLPLLTRSGASSRCLPCFTSVACAYLRLCSPRRNR